MSPSSKTKRFASATAALLFLAACKPGAVSDQPPIHLNPNMDRQEKYSPQSSSTFFEDGRSARPRLEGTVSTEQCLDKALTEGVGRDGHALAQAPSHTALGFKGSAQDFLQLGRSRFEIYCTPCHGQFGDATGTVAQKGYPGVANLLTPAIASRTDGQIYATIKHGVNKGNMPAFGAQTTVAERWAITAYVRTLQKTLIEKLPEAPADAAPSAALGEKLFAAGGCIACHNPSLPASPGPNLKGFMGSERTLADGTTVIADEAYLLESLRNPAAKLAKGGLMPAGMPPISTEVISDAQIKDLIEYLKTLK